MSFAVESQRSSDSLTILGATADAALIAAGAPEWLAHRMSDATRVASHYVLGHSTAPRIRLLVSVFGTALTIEVTDHPEQRLGGPPAWLPVTRTGVLAPVGSPDDGETAGVDREDRLQLHRTLDGHVRMALRTAWNGSAEPG
ncbi:MULTISPECIES: hypothetical protein [Streptomyces]|uniref:hypothetical protein n=1 Tax=Streptomyces TaxID=1883 RepID=UPI0004CC3710|nr:MULTISPECIES: hypothetical protein [Streptomyces]KOT51380.1 hypothetical protein ADK43_32230 [Streptomyces rimosus subsp. rimosus]